MNLNKFKDSNIEINEEVGKLNMFNDDEIREQINNDKEVNWNYILRKKILSEDFIREFQEKLRIKSYWDSISEY